MSFADRLANFNRSVTNRGMRLLSGRVPPLATVLHEGRRSGREYRTPVMAFRTDSGVVIALTYGPDRDWVRNIESAGQCRIEQGGRTRDFASPTILGREEGLALMPFWIRPVVSVWVDDFLTLESVSAPDRA